MNVVLPGIWAGCLFRLDIPMVRHPIKHIPTWPSVGMGVWRKYQRGRRLHHLRKMRKALV